MIERCIRSIKRPWNTGDQEVARLRRVLAVRAMAAAGMSQRDIAEALGISQPTVSQQLKLAARLEVVHPPGAARSRLAGSQGTGR